ncbi:MAG: hypothetical protein M1826_004433 [Phylliscum demangeonii]|nr:MAG: hypothetical protein M1826_004433 [Phylliscum demangeonii]
MQAPPTPTQPTPPSPPPSLSTHRTHPSFQAKLARMALPLAPLVSVHTCAPPTAFPATLLHFWTLTEPDLDRLAHFYHQRTPGPHTHQYPECMRWCAAAGLEIKRRKFGRFIGLRGCATPRHERRLMDLLRRAEEEDERWARGRGGGGGGRELELELVRKWY